MKKTVIKNGNLIDGNGGAIQENISILVEDGKIIKIVHGKINEDGCQVIDAEGKYIMPGLIDCHVHYGGVFESSDKDWVCENDLEQAMRSVEQCHQSLRHGFTTVRDISRNGIHLRNMINDGFLMGPRIIPCGRGLTRTGGHADSLHFPQDFVKEHHPWGIIADGPEEVRKAVRSVLKEGSLCVKLWASGGGINDWEKETDTHFTEEEIAVMVEEARLFGVPVAAHCENKDSIIKCIKAGVNSIEHGEEFDQEVENWLTKEYLDKGLPLPDITLVPTIGLYIDWYEQFDPPKERDLTGCVGETLGQKEIDRIQKSFRRAKGMGIRIGVGADSFCGKLTPYGMYTHNEMYELAAAGMTNEEVIVAATKNGAICLGILDQTGTIEENKDADILILTENPLENIKNVRLENIDLVMKQGQVVDFNNMSPKDAATIAAKKERTGKKSVK
ncbi:amidohydrolase family protein [bacterium 210820-DFI.6.37]|nr:amidohydrolase family protein [bacterium 210820-DFI.6.37]